MSYDKIAAVVLTLFVACADVQGAAPPLPPATSLPSLPPPRIADCLSFALLDDKCTADWYHCKRGAAPASCVEAWQDCCTLPGQGARSRLGSAQPVTTNR